TFRPSLPFVRSSREAPWPARHYAQEANSMQPGRASRAPRWTVDRPASGRLPERGVPHNSREPAAQGRSSQRARDEGHRQKRELLRRRRGSWGGRWPESIPSGPARAVPGFVTDGSSQPSMEDDEMRGRGAVRLTCATLLTAMTLSLTVVAHSAAQGVEDPRGRKARRERGREDQQTLLRDAKAIAK